MLDEKGFDAYADEYDRDVQISDEENRYPFAGYADVQNTILQMINRKPFSRVLDIGFGTGTLTAALYEKGHEIYGQDFSSRMIELASARMPKAHLYKGDFSKGLVEGLLDRKYDFIIATYSLHHLSDEEKPILIRKLLEQLAEGGSLLIGDIAFRDREALEVCQEAVGDEWDEEEHYFVADEMKKLFEDLVFIPKSHCSGVIILKNGRKRDGSLLNKSKLRECSYSPGYGDMRGEIHSEVLKKNEEGNWQIVCRDRESLNRPTLITTYDVSEEALADFEAFLEEKDVRSLTDREDSAFFLYDYSPWSYLFFFEKTEEGRPVLERYQIMQYKEYSDDDRKLLEELRQRFMDLRDEKISEGEEKDDSGRPAFLRRD